MCICMCVHIYIYIYKSIYDLCTHARCGRICEPHHKHTTASVNGCNLNIALYRVMHLNLYLSINILFQICAYVCACIYIFIYINLHMTCAPMPGVVVFLSLSTNIRLPLSMGAYHCFISCYLFRSLYISCTACRILPYRLMGFFLFYSRLEIKLILSYLMFYSLCILLLNSPMCVPSVSAWPCVTSHLVVSRCRLSSAEGDSSLQWRHNGRDSVSIASRLFSQPFILTQIKENIKAPRHWRPVNSPHKWPVTRKMFPFDDVIILTHYSRVSL